MEALEPSLAIGRARIHIYVPVDPELMAASLGKLADDKPKIVETVYRLIKIMTDKGFEVEFSPEGYSRQRENFDFTSEVIRAAVKAGATIINCPDTIGGASELEGEDYFIHKMAKHKAMIDAEFPNNNVIWSMHCHNDFGLAVQNSLNGVFSGVALQIEGAINGVGERAGNASLEQCIMIIRQFGEKAHHETQYFTNTNVAYLKEISDFIADKMLPRQPHFPITGKNSANHTSGGHTNAILKNPLAYQPFDPRDIGSEISFAFGPLSGGNHAQQIITKFNYVCSNEEKAEICQAIKDFYADRRKGITDEELLDGYKHYRSPIHVQHINYSKNDDNTTTVRMDGTFFDKIKLEITYKGKGSALSALSNAVIEHMPELKLVDYHSRSTGLDVDALCESTIVVEYKGVRFNGIALDEDIEESALKAFVNATFIETNFKL
jgi:2-isopropylmalate synthase